jgi:hypothetical protein
MTTDEKIALLAAQCLALRGICGVLLQQIAETKDEPGNWLHVTLLGLLQGVSDGANATGLSLAPAAAVIEDMFSDVEKHLSANTPDEYKR